MSNRVCVATGSRAEFYLLTPLIRRLLDCEAFDVCLAVTGAHLSPGFGQTYYEIEKEGFRIDRKIPILDGNYDDGYVERAICKAILGFSSYFSETRPDAVVILGDRYEMLGVAIAAMNNGIPIVHLHGGELTEGAIDDSIRHSITKMACLHFTSCEQYRKRVIQMGEQPDAVFVSGALGIDNIVGCARVEKSELSSALGFDFDPLSILVTYHPQTINTLGLDKEISTMIAVMNKLDYCNILITGSNADAGGREVNQAFESYARSKSNVCFYNNLGSMRYISCLENVNLVMGNSSSGILETALFGVPVVNVGDRQKGRIRPSNVIDCSLDVGNILEAVSKALSPDFVAASKKAENPYGDGHAADCIASVLADRLRRGLLRKESFYDIDCWEE